MSVALFVTAVVLSIVTAFNSVKAYRIARARSVVPYFLVAMAVQVTMLSIIFAAALLWDAR